MDLGLGTLGVFDSAISQDSLKNRWSTCFPRVSLLLHTNWVSKGTSRWQLCVAEDIVVVGLYGPDPCLTNPKGPPRIADAVVYSHYRRQSMSRI